MTRLISPAYRVFRRRASLRGVYCLSQGGKDMLAAVLALALVAQDDADVAAALDRFKTAMKVPSPAQRAEAILELGKTPLGKLGDASSVPAVQKCFYDKESRVVRQAVAV